MSDQPAHPAPPDDRGDHERRGPLWRGALHAASSMRLGFALLALIALYAVLGMMPIGLMLPAGLAPEWVRQRTVPQLPAFEMTPAMWFAAPAFRLLVAALLANTLLATLVRVPRRLASLGTWSTHLGIVALALGGAWHAAHAVDGELVLSSGQLTTVRAPGQPLQTVFADASQCVLLVVVPGVDAITIELASGPGGVPRFNDASVVWAPPGRAALQRAVYDRDGVRVEITGFARDARVALLEDEAGDRRWLPLPGDRLSEHPEWRGSYRVSALGVRVTVPSSAARDDDDAASAGAAVALQTWVPFASDAGAMSVRALPDGRRVGLLYTAGGRVLDGHAFRLERFEVLPFPGTDVPRDFEASLEIEHQQGIDRATISLNRPLVIRERAPHWLDRPLDRLLATRRFTLSLQGWDEQGWRASGRARFVVLRVSNAAGMPLIALGGWMLGVGVLWSVALRPLARALLRRWRERTARSERTPPRSAPPRRSRSALVSVVIGVTAGLLIAGALLTLAGPSVPQLGAHAAEMLRSARVQLIDDGETRQTVESWLARHGSFIAESGRDDGLALAARLWLEPATLIGQPVVAVPPGPLGAALLARAHEASDGTTPPGQPSRSGHRWPVEFVMEHLGHAVASGQADPRLVQDAELVLDRVQAALALIDGPALAEPARSYPLRARLERLDDGRALLWTIAGMAGVWCLLIAVRPSTPPDARTAGVAPSRQPAAALAGAMAGLAGAALVVRWVVAERLPMHNLHEALTLMVLLIAAGGAMAAARQRSSGVGPAMAAIVMAGLAALIAAGVPVPGAMVEREAGILASADLLAWHVAAIIAGYAAVAVNAALAIGWIARPSARSAVTASMRRLTDLSFALLTVGIALGAWWAHQAWGRWWAFDPKETFSLVLWLIVLAGVHVRAAQPRRLGRWLAMLALLALAAMLWNFIGVNLLLPGLHSYAS